MKNNKALSRMRQRFLNAVRERHAVSEQKDQLPLRFAIRSR